MHGHSDEFLSDFELLSALSVQGNTVLLIRCLLFFIWEKEKINSVFSFCSMQKNVLFRKLTTVSIFFQLPNNCGKVFA